MPIRPIGGLLVIALGASLSCPVARGQGCELEWSDEFYSIGLGPVYDMLEYDFGDGLRVCATGGFRGDGRQALGSVAFWDGAAWAPLGAGVDGGLHGPVGRALCVFDDGGGPALFLGGLFSTADGKPAGAIARWDGQGWGSPGGGMWAPDDDMRVLALTVFDDGSGPALYAGGDFEQAGGEPILDIARWDGHGWTEVGGGITGAGVYAMIVADLGEGPRLIVGGNFYQAGEVEANHIAVWDGQSWAGVGGGMDRDVRALAMYDAGSGPRLFAGGSIREAGGTPASGVAMWDGLSWRALGKGVEYPNNTPIVHTMRVHDDGSGPALYVGGRFRKANGLPADNIARYSAIGWSPLGVGVGSGPDRVADVRALLPVEDGDSPALLATGNFQLAGDEAINRVAKWSQGLWSTWIPHEGQGINDTIYALTTFDDGDGGALYVGGQFLKAGLATAKKIGRWDGQGWSAVGTGFEEQFVRALAVFDEGDGPRLFAGGNFDHAGKVNTPHVARWDGIKWTAVGPGVQNGWPYAMTVFDDGDGNDLYIVGNFTRAGQHDTQRIARWDGVTYSALGSGLSGIASSLLGFDDGSGPALYVGGAFQSAGGEYSPHFARWNGSAWEAIGADDSVGALAVYDDGGGPALYAGGDFLSIGQASARRLARWDGIAWNEVGGGVGGRVNDLVVFDDGAGPALYVGGDFIEAGGITARSIARWDGASWSAFGSGILADRVNAMTVYHDQAGPGLYALGVFESENGPAPEGICRLVCGDSPFCEADLDGSGTLDLFDFLAFVNFFNAADARADCDDSDTHDLFDFLCFVNAFNAGC
jgi:hypothetical protein